MKKLFKYPLLLAFFGFLYFFAFFDMVTPSKTRSEIENRELATMPKLSVSGLVNNSFTGQFETYLNDHFLLRDEWITIKSISESALMKTENNGIAYGTDGYMFEKNRESLTSYYERNIERVTQFVQSNPDLPITVAIVPGAEAVLSDKVPAGLPLVDQVAAIDRIYEEVDSIGGRTIDILTLLRERQDDYIYYRTDHHWTTEGALIVGEAFLKSVGRLVPELEAHEAVRVEGFLGTHYNKAKSWNVVPDTITYYEMPFFEIRVDDEVKPTYYDPAMFKVRDKYAAFMWGNSAVTALRRTENPQSRLLIIKDSYANSLAPYLSRSYDEVVLIDLRAAGFRLSEYLSQGAFDDVLIMYSFRSFGSDNNIVKINY